MNRRSSKKLNQKLTNRRIDSREAIITVVKYSKSGILFLEPIPRVRGKPNIGADLSDIDVLKSFWLFDVFI